MGQAGFRTGSGTRDQMANIRWIIKKQESSRKTSTSALLTTPKLLPVWITTNCGKCFRRWEYKTTSPASWEICVQVKKQQLEPDMEQQTCSKSGKEYVKAIYCHPAYLTSMQSASCEMLGWIKHTGIKIARRNVNNLRYTDDTTLMAECEEELKRLLMKWKRRVKRLALHSVFKKLRSWHPVPSHHGK